MKKTKILLTSLLFLIVTIMACNKSKINHKKSTQKHLITYTLTKQENTWGYKIFMDGEIIINQKIIPDASGYQYFKSAKDAEKIAKLVKSKLENNVFPPSVNRKELDSLEIDYDSL